MNSDGFDDLLVMAADGISLVMGPVPVGMHHLDSIRVGYLHAPDGDDIRSWYLAYPALGDFNGDGLIDVAVAKITDQPQNRVFTLMLQTGRVASGQRRRSGRCGAVGSAAGPPRKA